MSELHDQLARVKLHRGVGSGSFFVSRQQFTGVRPLFPTFPVSAVFRPKPTCQPTQSFARGSRVRGLRFAEARRFPWGMGEVGRIHTSPVPAINVTFIATHALPASGNIGQGALATLASCGNRGNVQSMSSRQHWCSRRPNPTRPKQNADNGTGCIGIRRVPGSSIDIPGPMAYDEVA